MSAVNGHHADNIVIGAGHDAPAAAAYLQEANGQSLSRTGKREPAGVR